MQRSFVARAPLFRHLSLRTSAAILALPLAMACGVTPEAEEVDSAAQAKKVTPPKTGLATVVVEAPAGVTAWERIYAVNAPGNVLEPGSRVVLADQQPGERCIEMKALREGSAYGGYSQWSTAPSRGTVCLDLQPGEIRTLRVSTLKLAYAELDKAAVDFGPRAYLRVKADSPVGSRYDLGLGHYSYGDVPFDADSSEVLLLQPEGVSETFQVSLVLGSRELGKSAPVALQHGGSAEVDLGPVDDVRARVEIEAPGNELPLDPCHDYFKPSIQNRTYQYFALTTSDAQWAAATEKSRSLHFNPPSDGKLTAHLACWNNDAKDIARGADGVYRVKLNVVEVDHGAIVDSKGVETIAPGSWSLRNAATGKELGFTSTDYFHRVKTGYGVLVWPGTYQVSGFAGQSFQQTVDIP